MSKFDFFEEGVRRVFENYEIPAGDNSWSDFQSKVGSGVSSGSFLRNLILPGIIVGGIFGGMNMFTHDSATSHNEEKSQNAHKTEAITADNSKSTIKIESESIELKDSNTSVDAEHNTEESPNETNPKVNLETSNNPNGGKPETSNPSTQNGGDLSNGSFESEIEKLKTKETIQYKGSKYKLGAPSKFTPNNDNRGDLFMPSELNNESNFVLEITDSNKNLVFKSKSVSNKWDGTILDTGKLASQGDYKWEVLKISDDKQEIFQGKVKLVR